MTAEVTVIIGYYYYNFSYTCPSLDDLDFSSDDTNWEKRSKLYWAAQKQDGGTADCGRRLKKKFSYKS